MVNRGGNNRTLIRVIELDIVYDSQEACARALGYKVTGINSVLRGRRKSYKGLHFEYVNPENTLSKNT